MIPEQDDRRSLVSELISTRFLLDRTVKSLLLLPLLYWRQHLILSWNPWQPVQLQPGGFQIGVTSRNLDRSIDDIGRRAS